MIFFITPQINFVRSLIETLRTVSRTAHGRTQAYPAEKRNCGPCGVVQAADKKKPRDAWLFGVRRTSTAQLGSCRNPATLCNLAAAKLLAVFEFGLEDLDRAALCRDLETVCRNCRNFAYLP